MEVVWKLLNRGQMSWHPQIDWSASPHQAESWEKNSYSPMVSYACKERICLELVADEYLGEIPDEASRGPLPGEEVTWM